MKPNLSRDSCTDRFTSAAVVLVLDVGETWQRQRLVASLPCEDWAYPWSS